MAAQIAIGDRVWWSCYDEIHTGVVAERFNAESYLVDRERKYSVLGTERDDVDLVNATRLHKTNSR